MKIRRVWALAAALALFAAACGGSDGDSATAVATDDTAEQGSTADAGASSDAGAPASALVASTVGGGQIDFGSLQGQDVLLWFWAPW